MTYHKVNYKANGTDFTDYFPAYEVSIQTIAITAVNINFQVSLSTNTYNTTNYVSFIQPYTSTMSYTVSEINQISLYDKTAASYNVWVNSNASVVGTSVTWWCVTFYIQETEKAIISSISNYKVNNSAYNPCSYFPQFAVDQNTMTTLGNISATNSLSTKSTTSTSYLNFGSITNNNTPNSTTAADVQKIIYYLNPKTATEYVVLSYVSNNTPNITLNTITMYIPTITVNDFVSHYKVDGITLEKTFPICESFTFALSSTVTNRVATATLTKNTRATTDYVVITSYNYYSGGNTGTYSPYEASINAGMPIISAKTSTSFFVSTTTSNGDNWYGALNCLVIYI